MLRCLPSLTLLAVVLAVVPAQAATRYVSPSGSDSAPCTATAPCLSVNRGYQVAAPGDVVEVAGGSYAGHRIEPSPKAAPRVTIRPAPGARPVLGDLEVAASHLQVLGPFETQAMETANTRGPYVTDVLIQDVGVDARGSSETPAWIAAVNRVTWRRVEVHNAVDASALLFIRRSVPQQRQREERHDRGLELPRRRSPGRVRDAQPVHLHRGNAGDDDSPQPFLQLRDLRHLHHG